MHPQDPPPERPPGPPPRRPIEPPHLSPPPGPLPDLPPGWRFRWKYRYGASAEERAYWREQARSWARHQRAGGHPRGPHPPPWARGPQTGPRRLWLWFMAVFGFMALLFVGSVAAVAMLLYWMRGAGPPAATAIMWSCALALALPGLTTALGILSFRGIARPLGEIIQAADAVAEGDLSVQVRERGRGPLRRLSQTFNRMTRELARSEQARRNLTADVAHELRNPLHVLQGNIEGVIDGVYQPTPEHMRATLEEVRLLARLVEDLRLLSQAETGGLTLHPEEVEISTALTEVAGRFSGTAQEAELQVLVQVAQAEGLRVWADSDRLDQVLSNLVSNALRHTPPGGMITLRAEEAGEGVLIQVADTGEGIAAEDLPYIFDRFWRGDRSRARREGSSSGLGLAISKQLIEAQGGSISVESQVGQGSVFSAWLPRYGTE